MSCARPSRRKNCGVRPQFYAARARPCAAGNALSFYLWPFIWALAFGDDLAADLRGMDFLVVPYNAVLNVRVHDDAVVANGYVGAYGAVLDDHVVADVARGNQLDVVHGLVVADDVADVVELGFMQPCSIIIWSASVSWNSPRVRMSLPIRCWSAFLGCLTSLM